MTKKRLMSKHLITKPVFSIFFEINIKAFSCDELKDICNIYVYCFAYMN